MIIMQLRANWTKWSVLAFITLINLLFPLRSNNRRAKKKDGNSYNGSGEEDIEMKSENPTYLPANVPDQIPEEHHYTAVNDRPVSNSQSTVKFPEAFADKSNEGVDTAIYQQLNGEGAGASIYQQLHSGPKFSEALSVKKSDGDAASIYHQVNNGPKSSEAWSLQIHQRPNSGDPKNKTTERTGHV